jgi:hypothetical protein
VRMSADGVAGDRLAASGGRDQERAPQAVAPEETAPRAVPVRGLTSGDADRFVFINPDEFRLRRSGGRPK